MTPHQRNIERHKAQRRALVDQYSKHMTQMVLTDRDRDALPEDRLRATCAAFLSQAVLLEALGV